MKDKRSLKLNLKRIKKLKEERIENVMEENKSIDKVCDDKKQNKIKKVGIISSGGDAPGLNAVIRAIVKMGRTEGVEVYGFLEGFRGLIENNYVRLDTSNITDGILDEGGTVIGTANDANPFSYKVKNENGEEEYKDVSLECVQRIKNIGLDCVFVLGGDGSLKSARDFNVLGANMIGIPKTIDNDVLKTDKTFGFDSAVSVATEALNRLETTAKSHKRIMVLEVMGRYAGWIALYAGVAGAADCILIPEIPFDLNKVAEKIEDNKKKGKDFALIIVSEGAKDKSGEAFFEKNENAPEGIDGKVFGGIGQKIAKDLEEITGIKARSTNLGYLQRGGSPVFSDRILSTTYGYAAMSLALDGKFGNMVSYTNGKFTYVSLDEVVGSNKEIGKTANEENGSTKFVPKDHILIKAGKEIGISFGE